MENILPLLIPALLALLLIRLLLMPMRLTLKLALHSVCGLLSLGLVNSVAFATGLALPVNAVTVLTAGFLGLPGIALLVLLALL